MDRRDEPADEFLKLIQNPFQSAFQLNAVSASLATSIIIAVLLGLLFSLVRPRHSVVYAPKVKHADRKHTPPPVGRGFFAWFKPVLHTNEQQLVSCIGLDATLFLRFTKMCRNIFIFMSIIGCSIMIPVNMTQSDSAKLQGFSAFAVMTPLYVSTGAVWCQVACAWAFDIVVAFFLWRNYRAVVRLRREYFMSPDYQRSLHARTLLITDIPKGARSEEDIMRLTDDINPTAALPRASVARNVKGLPKLIKEHEETVRKLESVLAKYLKKPDQLPPNRPRMRIPRRLRDPDNPTTTGTNRVDAIDFLTEQIQRLEEEIRHVRASVDKRDAMPFGFASFERIEHAHAVAYNARRKHPQGTTIQLAPRPHDLIWENLPLSPPARKWKRFMNLVWVTALTVVWVAPNAMIAIFLSNLSNLGLVWPAFQTSLNANPKVWAAVQGILSPAITSLVYLILPIIFRRLAIRAGDITKTSRERHVLHQLYAFFVFNNLIVFSLFSAAWTFVSAVIEAQKNNENAWEAIKDGALYSKVVGALCQVSPFWVSWLLQRNLGAALDLVQLVSVFWIWFARTFLSQTPRQAIEWTAPPAFEYASYYNYFLYYATVALCFATLQPIVLPVTALYFGLDAMLKKYLLMYVFVTKNESGGQYWRVLFNRMVFATILSNVIIGLVAKVKGTWTMVFCVLPLPFLMIGFKIYCMRQFDADCRFYNRADLTDAEAFIGAGKTKSRSASDKLSSKFGHPALYRPLITPMVHERAAQALARIYRGRLHASVDLAEYSDIALDPMSTSHPGKTDPLHTSVGAAGAGAGAGAAAPFEVIPENQLDFAYFKDRPEFREQFGGGLYGRPEDLITERSHTPRSMLESPMGSRASSPAPSFRSETSSLAMPVSLPIESVFRPPVSRSGSRPGSGSGSMFGSRPASRPGSMTSTQDIEEVSLLGQAAPPGRGAPPVAGAGAGPAGPTGAAPSTPVSPFNRWKGYGPVDQDE